MNWLIANWDTVWPIIIQHTVLAVVPTVLGLVIALPVGMLLVGRARGRAIAIVVASIVFTIPSLALFVVIPSIVGTPIISPLNVVIALTLYSTALLIRTVLESLDAVPADVKDASSAIGYSSIKRVIEVELPLAIPVLVAGLRVVAVTNVSLVSVGAVIGVGGLGQLFTAGFQRDYPDQIFAGIITILVLAFIFDRIIALIGVATTPWLRSGRVKAKRASKRTPNERTETAMLDTVIGKGNVV
ncbi:ABC transporter permease [Pseudoclavibacter sp. AY1F1]|uniref:ABC transporter permease n=1 Tax=Pseudoclavibacter sp. AY1F1 TaxID=2080583 RepID=UPI000CE90243|nr:ABC transporter permease [Pseudoclavibacter sp. AY1F1]PPF43191.1 ABC transporter permease [Pseudoclavibacter sp. AY1F1]